MKDSQKPDHVSLANMVGRLREGRYVIPDFQRDFEWEPWDIKELMSSIFRDYYIGSLLLWKGKDENFEALSCEAIYGFEGGDGRTDIVLDGQQCQGRRENVPERRSKSIPLNLHLVSETMVGSSLKLIPENRGRSTGLGCCLS